MCVISTHYKRACVWLANFTNTQSKYSRTQVHLSSKQGEVDEAALLSSSCVNTVQIQIKMQCCGNAAGSTFRIQGTPFQPDSAQTIIKCAARTAAFTFMKENHTCGAVKWQSLENRGSGSGSESSSYCPVSSCRHSCAGKRSQKEASSGLRSLQECGCKKTTFPFKMHDTSNNCNTNLLLQIK